MRAKILIFAALAIILGVPFALRPQASRDESQRDAVRLIIVTPHIEQIRFEFAAGFDRWHRRVHGRPAVIDWRTPGGTSEIIKLLQAQYTAAIKRGVVDHRDPRNVVVPAGAIGFDLMFGGGSFDHTRLKLGDGVEAVNAVSADLHGPPHVFRVPMSVPAGFTQEFLDRVFGENRIGNQPLYDPEQFWIGTALSSFGIVYNRDALAKLGVPEPDSFEDLTDPRLAGGVALADPRQSGSVTTTLDSILNNYGWERGWRILREMAANTRYFTNSAPKPPLDISAGEAAAGLAIDFYGRGPLPGIIAATIFAFTVSWAAFVYPTAFVTTPDAMPLTIGVVSQLVRGDTFAWGQIMAGALLAALPPVIVYAFLMDYYIAGLTAGATKG
ncbi:ABC transporter substrate-binding protein [Leptolyngbya sp. 15MV]|nr:ABC transporter substrate-binding protein [Leptolyngbya sp. 15MV]